MTPVNLLPRSQRWSRSRLLAVIAVLHGMAMVAHVLALQWQAGRDPNPSGLAAAERRAVEDVAAAELILHEVGELRGLVDAVRNPSSIPGLGSVVVGRMFATLPPSVLIVVVNAEATRLLTTVRAPSLAIVREWVRELDPYLVDPVLRSTQAAEGEGVEVEISAAWRSCLESECT